MKIHFWPDLLALIAIFHCMLSYNYFNPNSYYIANLSGWLVDSFLEYNSTFYQWFKGVNACDWTTSVYLYFMDNLKGVNAWDYWDTKEISSTKLQIHAYLILYYSKLVASNCLERNNTFVVGYDYYQMFELKEREAIYCICQYIWWRQFFFSEIVLHLFKKLLYNDCNTNWVCLIKLI